MLFNLCWFEIFSSAAQQWPEADARPEREKPQTSRRTPGEQLTIFWTKRTNKNHVQVNNVVQRLWWHTKTGQKQNFSNHENNHRWYWCHILSYHRPSFSSLHLILVVGSWYWYFILLLYSVFLLQPLFVIMT